MTVVNQAQGAIPQIKLCILVLYRDDGKGNGNYYRILGYILGLVMQYNPFKNTVIVALKVASTTCVLLCSY